MAIYLALTVWCSFVYLFGFNVIFNTFYRSYEKSHGFMGGLLEYSWFKNFLNTQVKTIHAEVYSLCF